MYPLQSILHKVAGMVFITWQISHFSNNFLITLQVSNMIY